MSTHTPGPWEFEKQHGQIRAANGSVVAFLGAGTTEATIDTALANGDLIAAAPNLLIALKNFQKWPIDYRQGGLLEAFRIADAAIAKAEGA